jgi:hypothetical protein
MGCSTCGRGTLIMTATENTHIFPRNRVLTTLMVVNTLLLGLCGILSFSSGKALFSMVWFVGALLFYINFLWSKKTPFIQLSQEGLTLSLAMGRSRRMVNWRDIASLRQVSEKKVHLLLQNGEQIKIALFSLNKEDRVPLLRRLDAQLAPKWPTGQTT